MSGLWGGRRISDLPVAAVLAAIDQVLAQVDEDGAPVSRRATVSTLASAVSALVLPTVEGRRLDEFGTVDRLGLTDMSALINEAIEVCAPAGVPLIIGPGIYRLDSSIVVRRGLRLKCSKRARFIAYFDATYGVVTVPNQVDALTPATRERDIVISGGRWQQDGVVLNASWPNGGFLSNYSGNIFALYVDQLVLDGITIDGYGRSRGMLLAGDDMAVRHCKLLRPDFNGQLLPETGQPTRGAPGGIRVYGGSRIRVLDCEVDSNDDALQFVPGAAGINGDISIEDAFYIGCIGNASNNKVCSVNTSGAPTCSIKNVGFIGIRGSANGKLLGAVNSSSSGVVDGVSFIDVQVKDVGVYDNAMAIDLTGVFGGLRNVLLQGVRVLDCRNSALIANGVEELHMAACSFGAPVDDERVTNTIVLRGCNGWSIRDSEVYAAAGNAILVGSRSAVHPPSGEIIPGIARRGAIDNVRVRRIPDGFWGVSAFNCDGLNIRALTVLPASESDDTANGVLCHVGAANVHIEDLDATEIGGVAVNTRGRLVTEERTRGAGGQGNFETRVVRANRGVDANAAMVRGVSPGTAKVLGYDTGGAWAELGASARAYTVDGSLMLRGQRVNRVTDPRADTANPVAAVTATGNLPSGWGMVLGAGFTAERLPNETADGITYAVFRVTGTPAAAATAVFQTATNQVASAGQVWTAGGYLALLDGSKDGLSKMELVAVVVGGTGTARSEVLPTLGVDELLYVTATTAAAGVGTTHCRSQVHLTADGTAIDITFGIALPTLEIGAFRTMPALPAVGVPAQVTRNAETLVWPVPAAAQAQGYLYGVCDFVAAEQAAAQGLLVLDDDTADNGLALVNLASSADLSVRSVVATVTEFTTTVGGIAPGQRLRFAMAWDVVAGVVRCVIEGASEIVSTSGALPTFTTLRAGAGVLAGEPGYVNVSLLSVGSGEISDAQLAARVGGLVG